MCPAKTPLACCLAALAAASWLSSQTFVVDAAGGPGSHFRDLPEAVAAVPDGATLRVRPGSYSDFGFAAKGLQILGDGAAAVVVAQRAPMRIGATGPGQDVVIAGLTFDLRAQPVGTTRWLHFDGIDGALVLDAVVFDVAASAGAGPGFQGTWQERVAIERCANAHLHRCALRSAAGWDAGAMLAIGPAAQVQLDACDVAGWTGPWAGHAVAVRRSRLVAINCRLLGGDSLAGYGGVGLLADGAEVVVLAGDIAGGNAPRGRGGDGVTASWARMRLEGMTPRGGSGAVPGLAWTPDPSAVMVHDPTSRPLHARATPPLGGALSIEVSGAPGSLAALWFGASAAFAPLEPLATGALLCAPSAFGGPFAIPPSGNVELGVSVPASLPAHVLVHGQCVAVEPTARLWASNSFPVWIQS